VFDSLLEGAAQCHLRSQGIARESKLADNRDPMLEIAPIDRSQLHRAFLEAFADYAMDAGGTTEEQLFLRAAKSAVDFDASVGLYDRDRLVGFTLIGIDESDGVSTAYDAGTGIVPAHRRQGWAGKMFDHAVPALRERGVARFLLEVLQENEPAIKAYTKSGFEIVRELRSYTAETSMLRELALAHPFEVRRIASSQILRVRGCTGVDSFVRESPGGDRGRANRGPLSRRVRPGCVCRRARLHP
jgi:ribosomal protein S18 acetylase RimI-like enzyme